MMEGVVNVLKPPGMTSSDVVVDIRHIFGTKRVGHTGTLDPGAAGVLPICVGRATRLFDYLVEKEKTYIAELCFGAKTDTQDSYGVCIEKSDAVVDGQTLAGILPQFIGEIKQIAPMYSAVKIDGKKLCDVARAGGEVQRTARKAVIHELCILDELSVNRFLIKLRCSRGTYVRTLCEDIGASIGVPAHMSFLLRTASGAFTIENTFSIAELRQMKESGRLSEALTSLENTLCFLPEIIISQDDPLLKKHLLNGVEITAERLRQTFEDGLYRVYCGEFVGIGRIESGTLRITLMLWEAQDAAE